MEVFFAFFLFQKKEGGGPKWTRTDDPLLAKQVLYQLSYTPSLARGHAPSKLNNVKAAFHQKSLT